MCYSAAEKKTAVDALVNFSRAVGGVDDAKAMRLANKVVDKLDVLFGCDCDDEVPEDLRIDGGG